MQQGGFGVGRMSQACGAKGSACSQDPNARLCGMIMTADRQHLALCAQAACLPEDILDPSAACFPPFQLFF